MFVFPFKISHVWSYSDHSYAVTRFPFHVESNFDIQLSLLDQSGCNGDTLTISAGFHLGGGRATRAGLWSKIIILLPKTLNLGLVWLSVKKNICRQGSCPRHSAINNTSGNGNTSNFLSSKSDLQNSTLQSYIFEDHISATVDAILKISFVSAIGSSEISKHRSIPCFTAAVLDPCINLTISACVLH